MTIILLFILAVLSYTLIRIIVNEIKEHITKEADRVIETLKNEITAEEPDK